MLNFTSCKPQKKIAGNYTYETECMGIEMDGSQTLKAWGYGKNRIDAVEQAKKNAVRDVLFKGIRNGKTECNIRKFHTSDLYNPMKWKNTSGKLVFIFCRVSLNPGA